MQIDFIWCNSYILQLGEKLLEELFLKNYHVICYAKMSHEIPNLVQTVQVFWNKNTRDASTLTSESSVSKLLFTFNNRPFYSCVLCDLAFEWK